MEGSRPARGDDAAAVNHGVGAVDEPPQRGRIVQAPVGDFQAGSRPDFARMTQRPDGEAGVQQAADDVTSDEPGRSRDGDPHDEPSVTP